MQWAPTSHFGLQVEQEVVRKPEDQQWITVTANNGFKHIPCTIQHIQTNTVLVHTMCFVLNAWHGLQYKDTAHTPIHSSHITAPHISIALPHPLLLPRPPCWKVHGPIVLLCGGSLSSSNSITPPATIMALMSTSPSSRRGSSSSSPSPGVGDTVSG